ncbi:hypothetical protein VTO42DRAFT_7805 [Malbranchea cinnamomea]
MAKDKDRAINPAQAQRKLEKQRALRKGKAEAQARRYEKLARRNPDRLQRQIDDLKAVEESGQPLRPHEKQILEKLEQELRAVKKAREVLGDRAPTFGKAGGGEQKRDHGPGVLGKRRREGQCQRPEQDDDSSDTDESVRRIPMPRDTPPPIPRQHQRQTDQYGGPREPHPLPQKPVLTEAKTVYEAAPAIRNLQQEAVSKFVPAAVRMKQAAAKGQGRLVEPEEMDKLEKSGYLGGARTAKSVSPAMTESRPASEALDAARLAEEEERFNREIQSVQIEEVPDEEL